MTNYDENQVLISLLRANSRKSIAELARKLNLSRSTVKDRIERLEKTGVITGYTIRLSESYKDSHIQAHVMISSAPKHSAHITSALRTMPAVTALYAVNGMYDQIAIVTTNSTKQLDQCLDEIGEIEGVEKTVSSIVLSTKFER